MNVPGPRKSRLDDVGFVTLVVVVSVAFVWLAMPYFGAVLWALVLAIVFAPLNDTLARRLGQRRGLAALLTLLTILLLVVLPAIALGISLVREATMIYEQIRSGAIDFVQIGEQLRESLPRWAQRAIGSAGVTDIASARRTLGTSIASGLQNVAGAALTFGTGALSFVASLGVMLYVTYFLIRDGHTMGARIRAAMPLRADLRDQLLHHFVVVVRATVKGSMVVALVQGILGGVIFALLGIEGALLWGLLMGFFALVPAVGTAIVWVPVAAYLFITGALWQGAVLVGCGVFVIGLVDNVLRPILVGQETRMPDFIVLISTLAGIELFGLNGFIIGPVIAALFIAVWQIVAEIRTAEPD